LADLWYLQSNLNRGELDPLTIGRKDLIAYYNGVQSARNVMCLPQGGLTKRPGTEFIGEALANGRLENFSFNIEQNYLLVFTAVKMQIYKDGDLLTDLNGSGTSVAVTSVTDSGGVARFNHAGVGPLLGGTVSLSGFSESTYNVTGTVTTISSSYFELSSIAYVSNDTGNFVSSHEWVATPWTLSEVLAFDYIQSADTIIITHPDEETRVITRSSDTVWTISTAGFTNIPQYDFNDASSPTPTSEIQTLNFANHTEGDRYKIALEGILTEEVTFAGDDDTNQENIRQALQNLINTGFSGISVTTDATLDTYRVTFADEDAKPWELMTVTPIYTINTAFAVATVRVQAGVARAEDSWSDTRGWPTCCTFHEGRLFLGGSSSRPATLWGSRVGDFFNFDKGRALDDEAIEVTLDTDQVNAIQSVFSNRSLQVFTSGGEFYVPESPITPTGIAVSPQSNLGTKRVRPVTIDGVTLFPQRTGNAIIQFIFLDAVKANQSRSISVTAAHLINDPVKLAASRGTETTDANYVYIVNDDGSMAVYNTLAAEEVSGFTLWETSGNIKSAAVVDNKVNLLVERSVDGSISYHIETENDDLNTDGSVYDITNDAEITGLDHLEGLKVWAKADGAFMGEYTVTSGKITLPRTSSDKEAGLSYLPNIQTMPLNVDLANGPNASAKKKIARISLQIYESNGIIVNEQRLADKTIALNQFDAPDPYTGIRRIHVLGWSLEATVTITQSTPMPMTILNIGMEIAV